MKEQSKTKAIALLSGGLDSTLAIKLVLEQGIEVVAVSFISPFCTCNSKRDNSCHLVSEIARNLGIKIRVLSKGIDYLKIVEKPKFGYGSGINPCIDCRIFIFKKAKEIMEQEHAQFIVTGEVLGQRPMSQHLKAMEIIERESGLSGIVERPLSAQCLPESIPEKKGLIDRSKLLNIRGRSRQIQLHLASEKGITSFGCPSGGCLLCDTNIARRLRDLFKYCPNYDMNDVRLVTFGRHFRIHPNLKIILGRNMDENFKLCKIGKKYARLEPFDFKGPLALICGSMCEGAKRPLGCIIRHFAHKAKGELLHVKYTYQDTSELWQITGQLPAEIITSWSI